MKKSYLAYFHFTFVLPIYIYNFSINKAKICSLSILYFITKSKSSPFTYVHSSFSNLMLIA